MPIHGYPGGVISATPPTVDNTTASGIWTTEKQLQYQAQGLWPPAVAQPISRSLRFNSADSTHLTRTPASASNQKTWTWSGWCKRSTLSTLQSIFSSRSGSAGCNLQWGEYSTTNDYIIFYSETVNVFVTTPVYRDASAWYHIVLALDTTQATASNRVKLYINGTQVTALTSTSYPSQNADLRINSANQHCIGSTTPSAEFLNGYLTEINFVDGQALTPSSFGQTNSNTGVWEPKAFSGTYGTNGFYLNFSDNSGTTSTTLGKDYSGNGNNWTPNNFSVTAGTGNDSLVDTPTNYGSDTGAGGIVRGNYCTWNPLKVGASVTVNNGNLYASGTTGAANLGVTATMGFSTGKWYWEIYCDTGANSNDAMLMAIVRVDSLVTAAYPGDSSTSGWAWRASANEILESSSNITVNYAPSSYTNGDTIMCAFDADAGKVWLGVNGTWSGSGVPASGTNPVITYTASEAPYIPAARVYNSSCFANFGQRPFAYTAPSGFKALCTQNLPTPTVVQGDDYFNTVLYTGTGSSLSVTGVGFQPDFTWIKGRSSATDHGLYDAVRGVQKQLESNTLTAETTETTGLTAFGTDGFTVGALAQLNTNTATYVGWNWKANGAGSSNTAGSITSTVSANTTSGFSVVTYTGNGTGGATVGHGLGASPGMVIIKDRSASTYNWRVYHSSLTASENLMLNATDAATANLNGGYIGTVSSTIFTLVSAGGGGVAAINTGSNNYVAYCFAAIPGFSAFGSYVGNGSSDGPFVYCGFRPAFLLTKRASTAGAWHIYDSARGTYNINDIYLIPDTSAAENSGNNGIDFLSNGFKLRSTNTGTNENGTTIIYAAFASNPFKYALAR